MSAPARLHILCVDDDVRVLAVLAHTLTAAGHLVDTALDGAHALQKIATASRSYEVMIVDERMPNVGGWRFIVQARAGGYTGRVILFSGSLDEAQRERFRGVEVDAVVEKPVRPAELVRIVAKVAATS